MSGLGIFAVLIALSLMAQLFSCDSNGSSSSSDTEQVNMGNVSTGSETSTDTDMIGVTSTDTDTGNNSTDTSVAVVTDTNTDSDSSTSSDTDTTTGTGTGSSTDTGSDTSTAVTIIPAEPGLAISNIKGFQFTWTDATNATHYKLLEDPDGLSGFTQIGADISSGEEAFDLIVPLHDRLNARYMLQSCDATQCEDSSSLQVDGTVMAQITSAVGYFKASNPGNGDGLGEFVFLSGDGNTIAIGAPFEDSDGTGVDSTENNLASNTGAVYVFARDGLNWTQQAFIKPEFVVTDDDRFGGQHMALSDDGNTLAIGVDREDSSATGIFNFSDHVAGGVPDAALSTALGDDTAGGSGAVYIFVRTGTTWEQQAYIKSSNAEASDAFGSSLTLDSSGDTLVVGARLESSNATLVNGDEGNNLSFRSGAAYVFKRTGVSWAQEAYLKASNTGNQDNFGQSVTLSDDGNTLAVSANNEDSSGVGINGAQDDLGNNTGAIYVYTRSGSTWSYESYIKPSNTGDDDEFGIEVRLSGDGNTFVASAKYEDSNATGIGGDDSNDLSGESGAVYVFVRDMASWRQEAYIKASNAQLSDEFGFAVTINGDGNMIAVSALFEDGSSTGFDDIDNDGAPEAGAVYVFKRDGGTWTEQNYLKATNTESNDRYGDSISMSTNGDLLVGASFEWGSIAGVGGDQSDNGSNSAGAAYLY